MYRHADAVRVQSGRIVTVLNIKGNQYRLVLAFHYNELLGSKGKASEILRGKRSLSKTHIAKLAGRFGVDVSLFFPRFHA